MAQLPSKPSKAGEKVEAQQKEKKKKKSSKSKSIAAKSIMYNTSIASETLANILDNKVFWQGNQNVWTTLFEKSRKNCVIWSEN